MATITGSQPARMYALAGLARAGATRSNYVSPALFVSIGGVHYATGRPVDSAKVVDGSLTITEMLNDAPNTCQMTVRGFAPVVGQAVVVTQGSKNNGDPSFAGAVLSYDQSYTDTPINQTFVINAIDYTWGLNRRTVTARYLNQSATFIAQDLVATWATGYTSRGVVADLPFLDEISFTNALLTDALAQLAARINGFYDVDYLTDVKLFIVPPAVLTPPTPLTAAHPTLTAFAAHRDLSQIVTRVLVEGGGVDAVVGIGPGETILPVSTTAWYLPTGGIVASGPQRIQYGGVQPGGGGSLVGPGLAPAAKLTAVPAGGSGITLGVHTWAYTWVTPSGETLPAPLSDSLTVVAGINPPPAVDLVNDQAPFTPGAAAGTTVRYGLTISSNSARTLETTLGPETARVSSGYYMGIRYTYTADMVGRYVNLYRSDNGGPRYVMRQDGPITASLVGVQGGYSDSSQFAAYGLAPPPPATNTLTTGQAALSAIAIGPATVTARRIYRTLAGGAQLKLLATLADNTTVVYTDALADGSLGANAPTSDTSGLTQPDGQVLPGGSSIIVASLSAFSPTGGWAVIGNGQQVVRYTGLGPGALTGIPVSGVGAIVAAVSYNSTITAAPALIGIPASGSGAIVYPVLQGDEVNILVTSDDPLAQVALAALVGGDGIQEAYIQDGRLGTAECIVRGRALLGLRSAVDVSVTYVVRDRNTRSGRSIVVNLPAPMSVVGSFTIQQVTITGFQPALNPTYTVAASPVLISFNAILQPPGPMIR